MTGGIEFLRLETVHAALVHFTIGSLPLIFISHLIGWWRRSAQFTFAGDVALVFGAMSALASVASGIVAFLILDWPHGLDRFAWIHIAFGGTTAATLVAFATARLLVRRAHVVTGWRSALTGCVVMVLGIATGWVGGEVLVFHAGMAVKGAAGGALAPPITTSNQPPASIPESMGRLRSHWAAVDVASAEMMVRRPTPQLFRSILTSAREIQRLAEWVADDGAEQWGAAGGAPRQLASMAELLAARANNVASAAAEENPILLARTLGDLEAACTGCHATLRWVDNKQDSDDVDFPQPAHEPSEGNDTSPAEPPSDDAPFDDAADPPRGLRPEEAPDGTLEVGP